jgi:hypothetical protein
MTSRGTIHAPRDGPQPALSNPLDTSQRSPGPVMAVHPPGAAVAKRSEAVILSPIVGAIGGGRTHPIPAGLWPRFWAIRRRPSRRQSAQLLSVDACQHLHQSPLAGLTHAGCTTRRPDRQSPKPRAVATATAVQRRRHGRSPRRWRRSFSSAGCGRARPGCPTGRCPPSGAPDPPARPGTPPQPSGEGGPGTRGQQCEAPPQNLALWAGLVSRCRARVPMFEFGSPGADPGE